MTEMVVGCEQVHHSPVCKLQRVSCCTRYCTKGLAQRARKLGRRSLNLGSQCLRTAFCVQTQLAKTVLEYHRGWGFVLGYIIK